MITGSGGLIGTTIKNAGQIAGTSVYSYNSFLYAGGTFTTIGALPGDILSTTRGMNDAGDVLVLSSSGTSSHAAIYSHGVLTMVPGSEGLDVQPGGINNSGQIVGSGPETNQPGGGAILFSNGRANFLGSSS